MSVARVGRVGRVVGDVRRRVPGRRAAARRGRRGRRRPADDGAGGRAGAPVGVAAGDAGCPAVAGRLGARRRRGVVPGRVVAQPAASTGTSTSRTGYAGRARRPIVGEGIRSSWQSRYGGTRCTAEGEGSMTTGRYAFPPEPAPGSGRRRRVPLGALPVRATVAAHLPRTAPGHRRGCRSRRRRRRPSGCCCSACSAATCAGYAWWTVLAGGLAWLAALLLVRSGDRGVATGVAIVTAGGWSIAAAVRRRSAGRRAGLAALVTGPVAATRDGPLGEPWLRCVAGRLRSESRLDVAAELGTLGGMAWTTPAARSRAQPPSPAVPRRVGGRPGGTPAQTGRSGRAPSGCGS